MAGYTLKTQNTSTKGHNYHKITTSERPGITWIVNKHQSFQTCFVLPFIVETFVCIWCKKGNQFAIIIFFFALKS